MFLRVRSYVRQHHVGLLCLFLILGGGTAYAVDGPNPGQNTIGSEDIIGNEVKSDDIGNGRIFNLDIADEIITGAKLKNGTVTGDDLALGAVGGSDIAGINDLATNNFFFSDPTAASGGAHKLSFVTDNNAGLEFIAGCEEGGAGNITASVVVKSIGIPKTLAIDSNAPNGANSAVNVAHGTETTLVSAGPTPTTNFSAGDYAITGFNDGDSAYRSLPSGTVSAATNFGAAECRFTLTRLR